MTSAGSRSTRPGTSVMAGEGMYNEHSQPQHAAGEDGLPLLARASEAAALERGLAVVIADYGSSQVRNSLAPMRTAVQALRDRLGVVPQLLPNTADRWPVADAAVVPLGVVVQ